MQDLAEFFDRPIAFHRALVPIASSVTAALLLSQAIYWQRITNRKSPGDWWYKTSAEWLDETGLTRDEFQTARRKLVEAQVLEYGVRGVPATGHYRVNFEELGRRLSLRDSSKLDHGEPATLPAAAPQAGVRDSRNLLMNRDQPSTTACGVLGDTGSKARDNERDGERKAEHQAQAPRARGRRKGNGGYTDEEATHARAVLAYLNDCAKTRFVATPTNLSFVVLRMREGYSPHVLMLLAYDRAQRWRHDPKMTDYLRPATLFNGEKCNQYAGQIDARLFRACPSCARELLPREPRCPECPAPPAAAGSHLEEIRKPMPEEIRRREGESVPAWLARMSAWSKEQRERKGAHGVAGEVAAAQ